MLLRAMVRQSRDAGSSDVARVASECGEIDYRPLRWDGKSTFTNDATDVLQKTAADGIFVAAEIHRTAQDDCARVDRVHQRHDSESQPRRQLHDHVIRE